MSLATIEPKASSIAQMPSDIAKSVVAVMAQIGTLGKDGDNKHASYRYVSVDKFFDVIGRLMAKEGLFVVTNEIATRVERVESTDSYGKSKTASWLSANYELFLCHSSGAICGPISREIRVLASGPQSYGSAASFVEKYFLRSLFKIPTGDEDIDGHPASTLPTPPSPPAEKKSATRKQLEASVAQIEAENGLDWIGYRRSLQACEDHGSAAAVFDNFIVGLSKDDIDEAQRILNEATARFWKDEP